MPDEGLGERLRQISDDSARFWELSSDLLCSVGSDGRFLRLNPAWTRMLGWTIEELRSRPVLALRASGRSRGVTGRIGEAHGRGV